MRPLRLSELQIPLAAQLHGRDCEFGSVSTDSRTVHGGDLFVALRGERFDGHDYLAQVQAAGAAAALVCAPAACAMPQLQVADTQRALGLLGAYNRQLYTGPLVAITGSSGKTTVKNMVHAVLSRSGETLATQGNLNNEIGVPLTLLRLHPGLAFAVVEMGAAKAGDIAWQAEFFADEEEQGECLPMLSGEAAQSVFDGDYDEIELRQEWLEENTLHEWDEGEFQLEPSLDTEEGQTAADEWDER